MCGNLVGGGVVRKRWLQNHLARRSKFSLDLTMRGPLMTLTFVFSWNGESEYQNRMCRVLRVKWGIRHTECDIFFSRNLDYASPMKSQVKGTLKGLYHNYILMERANKERVVESPEGGSEVAEREIKRSLCFLG